MSTPSETPREESESTEEFESVDPPIGWDGKTLQEMLAESESRFEETGEYLGIEEYDFKENNRFEYEKMFSQLRGALVNARETAMHISASPIVREIGELCFQLYTPEGDAIAVSTGIIVHVHTGSLAIKYMIEEDYEHDRGIEPGDIFCNNDNDVGNVQTADLHTFIPIFHDGELVAWVDGVTHELDIGGTDAGYDILPSASRYDDGMYAVCEKIGENDELFQDWKARSQRGVRTPRYFDLDEKCRLAGCQMIREAVHDLIDEHGVDTFKQFTREAIKEGQDLLNERVKQWMVPGTYRESTFFPIPFEDEAWKPKSKQDMILHLPSEIRVHTDGRFTLDMEGASPPGPHPFNASEGSMEGALWVTLTQNLLSDGKVNDGAHFGMDSNWPEGSVVNPNDPSLAYSISWNSMMPAFNGIWKNISRSFFARGYREEVASGYGETADEFQGGGELQDTGEYYPVAPFELSSCGLGASAVRDGLDWGYAMWNPEADLGDAEHWEETEKGLLYLGRQAKTNSAGHGKYRGGSGWEVTRFVHNSTDASFFTEGFPGVGFTSAGMSGGYPSSANYTLRGRDSDLKERIENREEYPVGDVPVGNFEEKLDGNIERNEEGLYFPREFDNYDVAYYQFQGAPGYGDPLERPIEKVVEDVEDGIFSPDVVENVYGVVGEYDETDRDFTLDEKATEAAREALREERREETVDFDEFWEEERERVADDEPDIADPILEMYDGVFDVSEEWAGFFRDFWELPDDYTFDTEA